MPLDRSTDRLTFPGHSGAMLSARLDRPAGPHLATALFAHCFTCGKDIPAARRIAARLAGMGIAVLRFDFTGLGHSEGEFGNTSLSSNGADLEAAAAHLESLGMAPSLLIGHSLGGLAVLRAAPRLPSVKAVATIGAPFDPAHVTSHFEEHLDDIRAHGRAEVQLGGRPVTIGADFLEDVTQGDRGTDLAAMKAALLVLHAPRDAVVDISNATRIFTAARHPKSFVTLGDADHLISDADDAEYVAEVIAAWVSRYLDLAPPAPPIGAPEGVTRVSEADPKGFLQDIQNGPWHHALADEPKAYGGSNRGMSPYGFLAAGLGACTSMTIRMYARRKGWPLRHVSVDVTHDKLHAQDAGTGASSRIDSFTRRITLEGNLSPKQRARLMEIADACPVHKTLETGANIRTELA
ncbi:alpha/beta fold hydrolase [Primorskyibacter sp. 2E107]|uniref:bifunctional alpha/beta hydrolase/OsmC family protein n=1 Tax=Primorskyibacter sp. 2E107 TaxID=3403458 RepID=UPI003AF87F72